MEAKRFNSTVQRAQKPNDERDVSQLKLELHAGVKTNN